MAYPKEMVHFEAKSALFDPTYKPIEKKLDKIQIICLITSNKVLHKYKKINFRFTKGRVKKDKK